MLAPAPSSHELPDDTAALCAAVNAFIRPGLRETRAITIADAFAEEVQLRASEFEATHNALIELAAVVRGEVRSDLRQAHPDWRLEALLTEELQLRKADADEATRVAVDSLKQQHVASIAAMQTTIDDLARENERLIRELDDSKADRAAMREKLRSNTAEIIGEHFVELLDETIRVSVRAAHGDDLCAALAEELRLRADDVASLQEILSRRSVRVEELQASLRRAEAEKAEGMANARIDLAAATADRDEARSRAAVLEAGLRDMERRVVQSQSRIIDLHGHIERRDHRASEIEAAIVDLVVAHHRACSNERIMRSALPDPRRAGPAAAEKSTVIPL